MDLPAIASRIRRLESLFLGLSKPVFPAASLSESGAVYGPAPDGRGLLRCGPRGGV
jgi:hypothetical protein